MPPARCRHRHRAVPCRQGGSRGEAARGTPDGANGWARREGQDGGRPSRPLSRPEVTARLRQQWHTTAHLPGGSFGPALAGASKRRADRSVGHGIPIATRGVTFRCAPRQLETVAHALLPQTADDAGKQRQKRGFALALKASETTPRPGKRPSRARRLATLPEGTRSVLGRGFGVPSGLAVSWVLWHTLEER